MSKQKLDYIPESFTTWILMSDGEGHFECSSKDDAIEQAKRQAEATPNLVLAIYRLEHLVSARVQKPQVFDPPVDRQGA